MIPVATVLALSAAVMLSGCGRKGPLEPPPGDAMLQNQPAALAHRFASRFPQDPLMTNLELWNEFEHVHPETFGGMYHFWLQRDG